MPDTATDTRTTGPVLETVTRFIVHCSRCNTPFKDEDLNVTALWTQEEFEQAFPADFKDWDDAEGWIRIGDRILCFDCWEYDEEDTDDERRVECGPLPADKAGRVARDRLAYQHGQITNPGRPIGMSVPQFLELLDDIRRRVAEGDSFEGFLEYLIPDDPDSGAMFDVRAGYRIGNSMGQGGFRVIEQRDEETP